VLIGSNSLPKVQVQSSRFCSEGKSTQPRYWPAYAEALLDAARSDQPSLIICDLHGQRIDPIELAKQLKADEQLRSIPLLGFFSHVQIELQRQAEEAGFDRVLPRSVFTRSLSQLLMEEFQSR